MAFEPFTGTLDTEEQPQFVPFTGTLDTATEPQLVPFTGQLDAATPQSNITPMFGEFPAPYEPAPETGVKANTDLVGSVMYGMPPNPVPKGQEFDPEIQRAYDVATPEERQKLASADLRFAELDKYYQEKDARSKQFVEQGTPFNPYAGDTRYEHKDQGSIRPASEEFLAKQKQRLDTNAPGYEVAANVLRRAGLKGMYGLAEAGGGQQRLLAEALLGVDPKDTIKTLDYINKQTEAIGDPNSKPLALIENGISSIIQQIPGLASGTEALALGSMFWNSLGQTFDDSRRQKLDVGESLARSAAFASFEVLGEKFGLGDTMKGIKAAAKGVPDKELSSYFAKALMKEIPGEQLTYAGQFATDKAFALNPEAGVKQFIDGAVDTLAATVVQGGMMLGGGYAINKGRQKYSETAATSRAEDAAEAARQEAFAKARGMFQFAPQEEGYTPTGPGRPVMPVAGAKPEVVPAPIVAAEKAPETAVQAPTPQKGAQLELAPPPSASQDTQAMLDELQGKPPAPVVEEPVAQAPASPLSEEAVTKPEEPKVAEVSAGTPVANPVAQNAPDPTWDDIQTGQPTTITMYQGKGKDKSEIYSGAQYPVAGEGGYYATTGSDAANYGDVTEHQVTLSNPLVIRNDAEWRKFTKQAGWPVPNISGMSEEDTKIYAESMKDLMAEYGYDGIVINMDKGLNDNAKVLRNVFGHDQAVVYGAKPVEPEINKPSIVAPVAAKKPRVIQYDKSEQIGVGSIPLSDPEGKPFASKSEAQKEKKNHPDMRVASVDGGFILVPKTEAQLAAQKKATERLTKPIVSSEGSLSAHEFIALNGGLSPDEMSDLGIEKNVRIGNRSLIAGKNKGMTIEQAAMKLQEAGYLDSTDHNAAYELIRRSIKEPQYAMEDVDAMAEKQILARQEAEYQDYLDAQQDLDDPFASLEGDGYTEKDMRLSGFTEASEEVQKEVAALSAMAEEQGIDVEAIIDQAARQTEEGTQQDFYENAKAQLITAIEEAAKQRSAGNISKADVAQEQETGLTAPTKEELTAKAESAEKAEAESKKKQQGLDAAEKAERERKEVAMRSQAASDTFELGQSAEDNLTGQEGLFNIAPQINTQSFKKWFDGSKVVGSDGKPMVMYHATRSDFSEFDTARKSLMGEGSFFSSTPYGSFADGEGGNIMPVYLSLKNPKIVDAMNSNSDEMYSNKAKLKKEGYDGLVITNNGVIKVAVAFDPAQIKSAIGNIGEFDAGNPDILFSISSIPAGDVIEVSDDVQKVISRLKKVNPELAKTLTFENADQTTLDAQRGVVGKFLPLTRIVRLMRGTSGMTDPTTIRHEITHSLEQMMSPEVRAAFIQKYEQAVKAAANKDKTIEGREFFRAVNKFMNNTTHANFNDMIAKMPKQEYYQYASPSEYWAVNAEGILGSYLGGSWQKFKKGVRSLFESLKNVLGMDNKSIFYKTFNDVINNKPISKDILISHYIKRTVAARKNYRGRAAPSASWTGPAESRKDDWIYKLQNKLVDTLRVQQAIENEVQTIKDEFNVYQKEELYHGRAAKQTEDFLNREMLPIVREMRKKNISIPDIDDYLHNRHAEERNDQVNKINRVEKLDALGNPILDAEGNPVTIPNPKLENKGSGISTEDARKYLNELDPERAKDLAAIASRIDSIIRGTQDVLVKSGMETAETVKKWNDTYKNYVPLMREDLDFVNSSSGMGGSGFGVRGSSSRRAMGSLKEVGDIFARIAIQRENAILRAERARVGNALYGLAIMNPNTDFWLPVNPDAIKSKKKLHAELEALGVDPDLADNLIKEPQQAFIDKKTGLVTYRTNPIVYQNDNVFPVRINGKDRYIFFNSSDPRALRMVAALRNLDAEQLSGAMNVLGTVTRWIASVNTQYNPIFGAWNFMRDVGGAQLSLSTTPLAGKQLEVDKHIFPALFGVYKDLRNERKGRPQDTYWADLYEDFRKHGGQTGYRDQFSETKSKANIIEREMKKLDRGNVKKAAYAITDWLSDYNTAMENAVRLAVYKTGLDNGLSKDKAASLAKNITVNFNRKGSWAKNAGALFAFFNASVQGTTRIGMTLAGPAGKKIIAGGLMLGVIQGLALAMAGLDDGDPPDYVKDKNLILPIGGGKYIMVPMPLGYSAIPSFSRIITEMVLSGGKDMNNQIAHMASMLLGSINPLGSGSFLQTVSPTALDPFVAISANRDSFGRPISKEDTPGRPVPGFKRSRENASEINKSFAEFLNWSTGGNQDRKGTLGWVTGDDLDYLVGQATGGAGRELLRAGQWAKNLSAGEETAPYKIPVYGKIVGDSTADANISNRFYQNVNKMAEFEAEIKGRRERREDAYAIIRENPQASLYQQANQVERQINDLNKQKKDLLAKDAPRERIQKIEERKLAIMSRFNDKVKAKSQ